MAFGFENDVLAPIQYFSHFDPSGLQPEKRLMIAILEDAIKCLRSYTEKHDGITEGRFCEARRWGLARDGEWPFSFENICNTLGLDPDYVRNGVLREFRTVEMFTERSVSRSRFQLKAEVTDDLLET